MVELMGSMKDIVSTVADSGVGVASLALVGLSLGGILPRVGLGRALSLRFRGYWKTTYPVSVRASEIKHFNEVVRRLPKERYIAVVGESGIGKTCLIDTASNRNFSVVSFSVSCRSNVVHMTANVVAPRRPNLELTKTVSLIRHFAH